MGLSLCREMDVRKEAQLCLTLCNPMDCNPQSPLSMGFSRQEYQWLPFPSPGDLPDPGIEAGSPVLQADALPSEPQGKPSVSVEADGKRLCGWVVGNALGKRPFVADSTYTRWNITQP